MHRSSRFWNWRMVSKGRWEGVTRWGGSRSRRARLCRLPGKIGWVYQTPPMPDTKYWLHADTFKQALQEIDAGTPPECREPDYLASQACVPPTQRSLGAPTLGTHGYRIADR